MPTGDYPVPNDAHNTSRECQHYWVGPRTGDPTPICRNCRLRVDYHILDLKGQLTRRDYELAAAREALDRLRDICKAPSDDSEAGFLLGTFKAFLLARILGEKGKTLDEIKAEMAAVEESDDAALAEGKGDK